MIALGIIKIFSAQVKNKILALVQNMSMISELFNHFCAELTREVITRGVYIRYPTVITTIFLKKKKISREHYINPNLYLQWILTSSLCTEKWKQQKNTNRPDVSLNYTTFNKVRTPIKIIWPANIEKILVLVIDEKTQRTQLLLIAVISATIGNEIYQ
jgi:hypothetical protein